MLLEKTPVGIFTATATRETKSMLFDMLQLDAQKTICIERNPVRANIMYVFQYLDKNKGMEEIFEPIINEVLNCKAKTIRTVIFCQTRKQCSLLFRAFSVSLGSNIYSSNELSPSSRYVDMFHAGTPESVKSHIIKEMGNAESCLRVLICTIAFGMGVNCRALYRSIHLGPPKSMEALLQETGRLGRDGSSTISYVLYNGILSTRCDGKMKELLHQELCRRREIGKNFSSFSSLEVPKQCMCCDNCAMQCDCGDECVKGDGKFTLFSAKAEAERALPTRHRNVSKQQKEDLMSHLIDLKEEIVSGVADVKPIGTMSIKFEFSSFQIDQIIASCEYIFTIEDVFKFVEIWRQSHASRVLQFVHDIFQDFELRPEDLKYGEEQLPEEMDIVHEDWEVLQHATTFDTTTSSLIAFEESNITGIVSEHDSNISGILSTFIDGMPEGNDVDMEN